MHYIYSLTIAPNNNEGFQILLYSLPRMPLFKKLEFYLLSKIPTN